MALGGVGYFATGYWDINYWDINYWTGAGSAPAVSSSTLLLMKAGSILLGLSYGITKWLHVSLHIG